MEDSTQIRCRLDDGSVVCLAWLQSGGLSVQRFKSGTWADGHGFLITGSGTVDAQTMASFLNALTPPPAAA